MYVVFRWFVWETELIIALRFQPVPNPYPVLFSHSGIRKAICVQRRGVNTQCCFLFTEEGGQSAVDQAPDDKSQVWLRGHHKETAGPGETSDRLWASVRSS